MNLLDLIIVLAAIAYGIGGFRSGAIVGIFSLIGFFGGAAIGAQVAGPIGRHFASGNARIPVAIICVLVVATIGQLLAVYLAGIVKRHVFRNHFRVPDAVVGGVLGVLAVLLVAWMIAVPLASSPFPALASEATHSKIVRAVNDAVPEPVRGLYSSLRGFLDQSGFPPVFGDLPTNLPVSTAPPPRSLSPAVLAEVRRVRRSTVKILGSAPECSRAIEGSGFVYAPDRILTNAHVVAGTQSVTVRTTGGQNLAARVVVFDPDRDVAVLDVSGLDAPALRFAPGTARSGEPAVVLGYPENGPFTVRTARVSTQSSVRGTNIYGQGDVERSIYAVRAVVRSGNSGGPLIDDRGRVLGMVFATALDSRDTGYVLTNGEIRGRAGQGRSADSAVSTQSCTPD